MDKYNKNFEFISNIDLLNENSWSKIFFLTFDMEWVHDVVLEDVLTILKKTKTKSTWFVTHQTNFLSEMNKNEIFELGIHPNFNFLLSKKEEKSADQILDFYMNLVPNAKSIRSHSLTQSSYLLNLFKERGFEYESNTFIPSHLNLNVMPWMHWSGLVSVPITWEDDIFMHYELTNFKEKTSLSFLERNKFSVFNFHPLHIYINSSSIEHYENAKIHYNNPKKLLELRHKGYGMRNFLLELIS